MAHLQLLHMMSLAIERLMSTDDTVPHYEWKDSQWCHCMKLLHLAVLQQCNTASSITSHSHQDCMIMSAQSHTRTMQACGGGFPGYGIAAGRERTNRHQLQFHLYLLQEPHQLPTELPM